MLNVRQPNFFIVVISTLVMTGIVFGFLPNMQGAMPACAAETNADREETTEQAVCLAPKAFLEAWELDAIDPPTSFQMTVPEDWRVESGAYPVGLYWGVANVFSKEIGLDMSDLRGKQVEVQIYELTDGLPGEGENEAYTYPANATLLVSDHLTVGAWLNFNVSNVGPSINKKSFRDITGLEIHEWIEQEGYFAASDDREETGDLSPTEVLDAFFDAINDGDRERAISFLGPYAQLQSLTVNKEDDALYNPEFGSHNSLVYNIVEAAALSYRMLDPESLETIDDIGDRTEIEFALDMHLVWQDEAFNTPDGKAVRFPLLHKYGSGWKIEGFGTGP